MTCSEARGICMHACNFHLVHGRHSQGLVDMDGVNCADSVPVLNASCLLHLLPASPCPPPPPATGFTQRQVSPSLTAFLNMLLS